MDFSKFAGMSWDVVANHVQEQKVELPSATAVNKLPREDISIYGRIVDAEPLHLIVCEKCEMLVKAQALLHHYATKHPENPSGDAAVEDCSGVSPMVTSQRNVPALVKDDCNTKELSRPVVNENTLEKIEPTKLRVTNTKRIKRLGTKRFPLNQISTNRFCKRKESVVKNKLKKSLLSSLHHLSELSLNPAEKKSACGVEKTNTTTPNNGVEETNTISPNSTSFVPNPPKPVDVKPLFPYRKVGGLLYSGGQMERARTTMEQMFSKGISTSANIFQKMKVRRSNLFDRPLK